jgi:hypothetical protein
MPVAPVKSCEPGEPVNPVCPIIPVEPVNPVNPLGPVQPVLPENPVKPVAPLNPVNPLEPVDPVVPVNPVDPCCPRGPVGPGVLIPFDCEVHSLTDDIPLSFMCKTLSNNELISIMAQPVTYQQLLAEHYEESARDRLVFQNMDNGDENEDRQIDPHISDQQAYGYETVDPTNYKGFAGNRHLEEDLVKTKDFEDKSKLSVRYNKDVKLNVFNVDSRFRSYAAPGLSSAGQPSAVPDYNSPVKSTAVSFPSHFIFKTSKLVKNAMSITLTSLELPNTFWNFMAIRKLSGVYSPIFFKKSKLNHLVFSSVI